MTILQAGKDLTKALSEIYDSREANNITQMVMERVTSFTNTERLLYKQFELTKAQQKELAVFTDELLLHKPVQYVLNEAWFAGMKLYVDENVLIPRPETEELTELIIAENNKLNESKFSILDVGTGSGCIAMALKKKLPLANVYGLDISKKAIEIAQRNADENKLNIHFFQADILNYTLNNSLPIFDVIVSNPPYIKQTEANEMDKNIVAFEPHEALFVPDNDALVFYGSIADFSLQYLNPQSGKLYFEINEALGKEVCILLSTKNFAEIQLKKDMQGKDRIVSAILKDGIYKSIS